MRAAVLAAAFLPTACSNPASSSPSTSAVATASAAYEQDGGTVAETGKSYAAASSDESVLMVYDGGAYSLTGNSGSDFAQLRKSGGDSTSTDDSNFYGLNAIVLAKGGGAISLRYCALGSSAEGANGAFAYGSGSSVTLKDCTIATTGDSSRGVDATYGGAVTISDSTIATQGAHCAALASDRYDGTAPKVTATNVSGTTSGDGSPGIYCTGTFAVTGCTLSASGSEAAAIEGKNSITVTDSALTGSRKWGVIIYQSTSGDSATGTGTFSMTGGTLTNKSSGPVFMVCDTAAVINLDSVTIDNAGGSGLLLRATSASSGDDNINSSWGSLGGTVTLNATNQTLTGAITRYSTASNITLNLKSGSIWTLTADSTVDTLTVEAGAVINKNGHTLTVTTLANNGTIRD